MGWTINKIIFNNFKVFKDEFTFTLEGRNLLLFGENGSGKSSLSWGLYTFLQSVLKLPDTAEAMKYFNPAHDQNLRNRFSVDTDYSGIKVEFRNTSTSAPLTLEDSMTAVNTDAAHGINLRMSLGASDFLNYKYLHSVFDFRNSVENNLFPLFYQEIFPIDDFSVEVHDHTGTALGKNMQLWWRTLQNNLTALPRGSRRRSRNHTLRRGSAWDDFEAQLNTFNDQLKQFIDNLEISANDILSTKFGTPVRINFTYHRAEWAKTSPDSVKGDLKLVTPKIIATASYLHPTAINRDVTHPRSFFNEATLSKLALALRLAVTDNRINPGPDICKILVIDDLLISLDMANRSKVIDIILDYSADFQMLILTHDRAFYQVVQNKIEERKAQSKWKFAQIYIRPSLNASDIPRPVFVQNKPGLDQAKDFYLRGEFEAAVVTLRKECEANIKRIVPFIEIINADKAYKKGEIKYVDLSKMIAQIPLFYDKHYSKDLTSVMPNPTPNLHTFRELLLNQAAHDDYGTPRFKQEIEDAFVEIGKLADIKKYILVKSDKVNIDDYEFRISDIAGTVHDFQFRFEEVFSVLSVNSTDYCLNSAIIVRPGAIKNTLYRQVSDFCAANGITVPSDILASITHVTNGRTLRDELEAMKRTVI